MCARSFLECLPSEAHATHLTCRTIAPPARYPDRIPVICEKDPRSDIPPVDKRKYLIPMDLTVGQFVYVIRKRITIPSDKAIFIFVNNTLPPTAALMSAVYEQHRDEDGFMYMMYSGENTFGEPSAERFEISACDLKRACA